jgi:hypothetical protein
MPTPSILLIPDRYKTAVLYSQIPDSGAVDFDVTRATTAYRSNASGLLESVASGVPRLDYPALGGCPSLLVEPAATNLVLRSEEFDNGYWALANATIIPNAANAPNGTLTADKIYPTTTGFIRGISRDTLITLNAHAGSVFAKWDGGTIEIITLTRGSLADISFNVRTGQIVGTIPAGMTASISSFSDGWYRCAWTYNSANLLTFYQLVLSSSANSFSVTANGTDGIFLWGAQLETGSVATSYIPTVAATATRNADLISKTGVSGFIGQTEGTLYAEVDISKLLGATARTFINIGSASNGVFLGFTSLASNTIRLSIDTTAGAGVVDFRVVVSSAGTIKVAAAYKNGDCALYVNGVAGTIVANGSISFTTISNLFLGQTLSSTAILNDRIRAAAIYTTRLSNSELAALTTL